MNWKAFISNVAWDIDFECTASLSKRLISVGDHVVNHPEYASLSRINCYRLVMKASTLKDLSPEVVGCIWGHSANFHKEETKSLVLESLMVISSLTAATFYCIGFWGYWKRKAVTLLQTEQEKDDQIVQLFDSFMKDPERCDNLQSNELLILFLTYAMCVESTIQNEISISMKNFIATLKRVLNKSLQNIWIIIEEYFNLTDYNFPALDLNRPQLDYFAQWIARRPLVFESGWEHLEKLILNIEDIERNNNDHHINEEVIEEEDPEAIVMTHLSNNNVHIMEENNNTNTTAYSNNNDLELVLDHSSSLNGIEYDQIFVQNQMSG